MAWPPIFGSEAPGFEAAAGPHTNRTMRFFDCLNWPSHQRSVLLPPRPSREQRGLVIAGDHHDIPTDQRHTRRRQVGKLTRRCHLRCESVDVSNEVAQRLTADQTGTYTISATSNSLNSQLRIYDGGSPGLKGITAHSARGVENHSLGNYPTRTLFCIDVKGYQAGTHYCTLTITDAAQAPKPSLTYSGAGGGNINYSADLDGVSITAPSVTRLSQPLSHARSSRSK